MSLKGMLAILTAFSPGKKKERQRKERRRMSRRKKRTGRKRLVLPSAFDSAWDPRTGSATHVNLF